MSAGHAFGHQTLPRHFTYLRACRGTRFFFWASITKGDPKLSQRPLINRSSRRHFVGRALLSFTAAPSAGERSGSERKQPPAVHKEGPREHAEHAARLRPEAQPGSAPELPPRGSPAHLGAPESAEAPASRAEGKAKQGIQHQPKQGASKRAGPVGRDDDASGGAPAPFAACRRRGGATAARRHAQ